MFSRSAGEGRAYLPPPPGSVRPSIRPFVRASHSAPATGLRTAATVAAPTLEERACRGQYVEHLAAYALVVSTLTRAPPYPDSTVKTKETVESGGVGGTQTHLTQQSVTSPTGVWGVWKGVVIPPPSTPHTPSSPPNFLTSPRGSRDPGAGLRALGSWSRGSSLLLDPGIQEQDRCEK